MTDGSPILFPDYLGKITKYGTLVHRVMTPRRLLLTVEQIGKYIMAGDMVLVTTVYWLSMLALKYVNELKSFLATM